MCTKPIALMAAALFLSAVGCLQPSLELPVTANEAHCQSGDFPQALGINYRKGSTVAPHIVPGNSSGLLDSYANYWSGDTRFRDIRSQIGCLTRVYNSVENGREAMSDPSFILFAYARVEPQPLELIEESPIVIPAIGHQSLAFRTDASRNSAGSENASAEVLRDHVATTVMFRRETVVVTITISANCFGFNRQLCDTMPDLLADGETIDGLVSLARLIDSRVLAELG